jgi:hypothetical protein
MSADTTPRHVRTYVMKHQESMYQMASLAWAALLAARTPSVVESMIEKRRRSYIPNLASIGFGSSVTLVETLD